MDAPKDNTPARIYKRKAVSYEGSDQIMKIETRDIDAATEQIAVENPDHKVTLLRDEGNPDRGEYFLRLTDNR